MELVESIKLFFNQLGINWNGSIFQKEQKDFIDPTEDDFKKLEMRTFMIEFEDGDCCGLVAEIDNTSFRINGEDERLQLSKNSLNHKDNILKLREIEYTDFSEKFIKFQLKTRGLVYATLVREKLEEKKNLINSEAKKREKQLTRKIEFLNRSVERNEETRREQIQEIDNILQLTNQYTQSSIKPV